MHATPTNQWFHNDLVKRMNMDMVLWFCAESKFIMHQKRGPQIKVWKYKIFIIIFGSTFRYSFLYSYKIAIIRRQMNWRICNFDNNLIFSAKIWGKNNLLHDTNWSHSSLFLVFIDLKFKINLIRDFIFGSIVPYAAIHIHSLCDGWHQITSTMFQLATELSLAF